MLFTNIYIIVIFSCWDPQALQESAWAFRKTEREKQVHRTDLTRDDLFITYHPYNLPQDLIDFLAGKRPGAKLLEELLDKPIPKMGKYPTRDRECMGNFLSRNRESGTPVLPTTNLRDFMIGEAPFIHHLYNAADTLDTDWLYPSRHHLQQLEAAASIDNTTYREVTVSEVTIRESSEQEFEQFAKWVFANHKTNQDRFPSGLVSLDVEEIKIPTARLIELQNKVKNWDEDTQPIIFPIPSFYESECKNIPAKIIFGDGIEWFASIRFNWSMIVEKGRMMYKLDPTPIPPNHLALTILKRLKYFTGQGIMSDRNFIQQFFKFIYNMQLNLPKVVEIDALSHAAGYRLNKSGMFITNLVTMGGLLNKEASCADGLWCMPIESLPRELLTYLIGDVRFGYCNSIVYLTIMMRNMFPDPVVLCSTLELTQSGAVSWFSHLAFTCLNEVRVDGITKATATTRQDLIRSLLPFDEDGKLIRAPKVETELFGQLIPDWPSPIHGGARYLDQVLSFFVHQFQILQEIKRVVPEFGIESAANLDHQVDERFIRRCTFARGAQRDLILPGSSKVGLGKNPSISVVYLDITNITDQEINTEAARKGRPRELGILEMIRLHPSFRFNLLHVLRDINFNNPEYSFWLTRITLYNDIKHMISILIDKNVVGVPRLEQEITRKYQNVTDQEEKTRKKDERVVKNRKKREELFKIARKNTSGGIHKRTSYQQSIYSIIPGDHTARNQRNRRKKNLKMAIIRQLPDFVPEEEWNKKKIYGARPSRPNFLNFKDDGHDLRDVLHQSRQKANITQTYIRERDHCTDLNDKALGVTSYDLRDTLQQSRQQAAGRQTYNRESDRCADHNDNEYYPRRSPSPQRQRSEERRCVWISPLRDVSASATTSLKPIVGLDVSNVITINEVADPYQSHFCDPANMGFVRRVDDGNMISKKKGKGKGKNHGKVIYKPRPDGMTSSDSDAYPYM